MCFVREKLDQQNSGEFSMIVVISYKVIFLMDSKSIDIVFQDSEWCIIEEFEIFKMASNMSARFPFWQYL